MKGWHFCSADRRLGYGDGRLIEAGKTLSVDCEPRLCLAGLHASVKALDGLRYAPGLHAGYVELRGIVVLDDDKGVATERHTYWVVDATQTVLEWTRWCALRHVGKWDAPDVVLRFLKTGKNAQTAWAAARAAAWATADAAADAAWAAAGAADAAWAAEGAAAGAAKAAAWAAADAAADAEWATADAEWATADAAADAAAGAAGAAADAAWAAARAAADAARAAADAAGAAADAARAAADAARAAEKEQLNTDLENRVWALYHVNKQTEEMR